MSNRPNDFDDDDFNFDDDADFRFDNDDDVDFNGGLGDDFDDDLPALDDDGEAEGRGPSRTFIVIAAIMIILFLAAIALLVFLSTRPTGPTEIEQTATAIAILNSTTIAQGVQTETQSAFFLLTETQNAINAELTAQAPTATPTASPSPTVPTNTPTPTFDATQLAAFAIQTQTSVALTQAAEPTIVTETPTSSGLEINAVAQTATALVAILVQPTIEGQGGGQIVASPTGEGGFAPRPTALPDTGLFDDIAAGNPGSFGAVLLAIVGLAGIILVSRRLRTINK